jgi:hypothetical protein
MFWPSHWGIGTPDAVGSLQTIAWKMARRETGERSPIRFDPTPGWHSHEECRECGLFGKVNILELSPGSGLGGLSLRTSPSGKGGEVRQKVFLMVIGD